jgi:putative membrane-bound dehydrogenase-like protein
MRLRGLWLAIGVGCLIGNLLSDGHAQETSQAARGLTPADASARMTTAAGFTVELVAAEPLVRQPVAIEFDDRGRLWVIQYLQYPNPAGLQRVAVDRYSRTRYDRVPEPPPHGPRGADRITILEDRDRDGVRESAHDFVDGLNLASGFAFGHGGVFVLQVPYLLFYADRDRDDVPDGPPQVLLTGFGMEDAHSVANSLTFGPDGWLYGCQGSTVTANIRGLEFQQGVWRYHPLSQVFELFCEGGGNTWGLDFDRDGRLYYSTNYGNYVLVQGVQGGYFVKSFGKHGALHNPHAYGYFDHAPHARFRGGHVTVGGVIYQGDLFPPQFRGKYIAGDLLGHGIYWHDIEPRGSTVQTAHGGELLLANDPWFAPTDVTQGPDGAIYVTDWHDARTAHPDPDADWDRSNGRIYRIRPRDGRPAVPVDLVALSTDQLLDLHRHQNQWLVRRSRQELTRRFCAGPGDAPPLERLPVEVLERLRRAIADPDVPWPPLEVLWTLHVLGGFDEAVAQQLLKHPQSAVRAWTVRLLGDRGIVSAELARELDHCAELEPDVGVRLQLAVSAQRFPADVALPIINANIHRDLDGDDPYLPLMWWWAVERHSVTGRDEVLRRFTRPTLWQSSLGRDVLLPRLLRRYVAEGTPFGLDAVVRLWHAAPAETPAASWGPSLLAGWNERPPWSTELAAMRLREACEHPWTALITAAAMHRPNDMAWWELSVALGDPAAIQKTRATAFDPQASPERRQTAFRLLGRLAEVADIEPTLAVISSAEVLAVRIAAAQFLGGFDDPQLSARLISAHQAATDHAWQSTLREIMLSHRTSARVWLEQVDQGLLPVGITPVEQLRQVALHDDDTLNALVAKHWGRLEGSTREEKLAEVRRLNNDLRAAAGDFDSGQRLFQKHCAACHQLHGAGTKIGPDLTSANRQDREYLLISLVDPSSVIRKEYVSVIIETTAGRVVTGFPLTRTAESITLVDPQGKRETIAAAEIAAERDSAVSLMPENLYRRLSPQELRDLFAYLQRP